MAYSSNPIFISVVNLLQYDSYENGIPRGVDHVTAVKEKVLRRLYENGTWEDAAKITDTKTGHVRVPAPVSAALLELIEHVSLRCYELYTGVKTTYEGQKMKRKVERENKKKLKKKFERNSLEDDSEEEDEQLEEFKEKVEEDKDMDMTGREYKGQHKALKRRWRFVEALRVRWWALRLCWENESNLGMDRRLLWESFIKKSLEETRLPFTMMRAMVPGTHPFKFLRLISRLIGNWPATLYSNFAYDPSCDPNKDFNEDSPLVPLVNSQGLPYLFLGSDWTNKLVKRTYGSAFGRFDSKFKREAIPFVLNRGIFGIRTREEMENLIWKLSVPERRREFLEDFYKNDKVFKAPLIDEFKVFPKGLIDDRCHVICRLVEAPLIELPISYEERGGGVLKRVGDANCPIFHGLNRVHTGKNYEELFVALNNGMPETKRAKIHLSIHDFSTMGPLDLMKPRLLWPGFNSHQMFDEDERGWLRYIEYETRKRAYKGMGFLDDYAPAQHLLPVIVARHQSPLMFHQHQRTLLSLPLGGETPTWEREGVTKVFYISQTCLNDQDRGRRQNQNTEFKQLHCFDEARGGNFRTVPVLQKTGETEYLLWI